MLKHLKDRGIKALFVCGQAGSGKSLTLRAAIACLAPHVDVVYAISLVSNLNGIYVQLWEKISGLQVKKNP